MSGVRASRVASGRGVGASNAMPLAAILVTTAALAALAALAGADSLYARTGRTCDFENSTDPGCGWSWKKSEHGFRVVTGQEIGSLQTNVKGLSGPTTDANNNTQGHFLFLNVQPNTPRPLNVTSPFQRFSKGACELQFWLHTANVSQIAVFAEAESSKTNVSVRWDLRPIFTDLENEWRQHSIQIGRVSQNIRVVIEIANNTGRTGHVAIDNLQLVSCFHGSKLHPPHLCNTTLHFICSTGECLNHTHVCDLVKDCPSGDDESEDCALVPPGAQCDFQNGLCGWTASQPKQPSGSKTIEWATRTGYMPKRQLVRDHTYGNDSGAYLYVDTTTGEMGNAALLDSPVFNPPPEYHRNESSPFYKSCEFRFFYHQFGMHGGSLGVMAYEYWPRNKRKQVPLFYKYRQADQNKFSDSGWSQGVVFLPPIKYKYQIHLEARKGMRASDLAVDDVSFSPECFGLRVPPEVKGDYDYNKSMPVEAMEPDIHRDFINKTVYRFTTCGSKGMSGPTEQQCASAYNGTATNVTVLMDGTYTGVQRWVVPETDVYTVIARGASGGSGSEGQGWSLAAEARAILELKSGDVLHILVGQEGTGHCRKGDDSNECRSFFTAPNEQLDLSKKLRFVVNSTGGGGGGGGSFVFKRVRTRPVVLLVAAGGGGLGSGGGSRTVDDERQHGHAANETRGSTAGLGFGPSAAGPGGGWSPSNVSVRAGLSLMQGGLGGRGCLNSSSGKGDGGFGGGGGGCFAGGGGGGYSGGNAWSERSHAGEGGFSLVKDGTHTMLMPAAHEGAGEIIIIPGVTGCDCQHRCIALNVQRSRVECTCPPDERVNGNICKPKAEDYTNVIIPALGGLLAVLVILVAGCAIYTYNKFQRGKEMHLRRKGPSGADLQLRNLRNDLMTETNPNYEFAGERYTLKDLKEVPREHLRLLRALGQGAFGEVYEGLYKMRPGDAVELPVAVKTLPELSTLQAENDFMLEALIMGKFNHPNIVHLIGVCFDKHPRYIVLELLSGGDLKTFLRESRPRNDRPSPLNMRDLLLCCMDVAKGCKYLEENRFIHRDIAARNCLLTAKTPGRIVKIADFGMAREVYMSDYYRKGGKAMLPIKWMPPEAFLDGIFTTKTDVWSYGVLLWEVMSLGYMPYTGCANRNVMSLVVSGGRLEPPPNCPPSVYAIMTSCWHPEPPKRPDFATILDKLATCLQDPDTLATPLRPMTGLSESDLRIRYSREYEAVSKSLALSHGWYQDSKASNHDSDALTSPPALSVAPSQSSELSDLSSPGAGGSDGNPMGPMGPMAMSALDRSPAADYLVPMATTGTPPSHALPPAPPPPHRPPPGPAPGDGWLPGHTPTRSRSKQPLLQGDSSSSSLGSLLGIDKPKNGPLGSLANGKDAVRPKTTKAANPLPLDPALLAGGKVYGRAGPIGPHPKLRTDGDGAPSPIGDTEISC